MIINPDVFDRVHQPNCLVKTVLGILLKLDDSSFWITLNSLFYKNVEIDEKNLDVEAKVTFSPGLCLFFYTGLAEIRPSVRNQVQGW